MLECLGVAFDCKHYNQYMQKNLDMSFDLKSYHFRLGNVYGESESVWWNYINLKRFDPSDPETKTILFRDCDHFSHILPKDLTCLFIEKNSHWVCLCDALSYNTSSSLRRIGTYDCQQLESLFCLSGCCSFCTKIHNLEVLVLGSLESLSVVFKDVVEVRQSLTLGGILFCLKEFSFSNCHLIEKLFTPQLVLQLQNLETIAVHDCNSMKEIFAMSNNDDNDDSSSITLPKLTTLELYNLPQLQIVCKRSIRCGSSPLKLDISKCPSLERHPTIEIEDVGIPCFWSYFLYILQVLMFIYLYIYILMLYLYNIILCYILYKCRPMFQLTNMSHVEGTSRIPFRARMYSSMIAWSWAGIL